MSTITALPSGVSAQPQVVFQSRAIHVIQPYGADTFAEVGVRPIAGVFGGKMELLADYSGIVLVPFVVTHRTPGSVVKDLQATLVPVAATNQT